MKIVTKAIKLTATTVFAYACILSGTMGALIMAVWGFGEDLLVLL